VTDDQILPVLNGIFREVFEDPTIVLRPNTTADEIPEWDSMSQVTLAVEVEHCFKMKFRSSEMEELRTVREMVDLIKTRLSAGVT
jgi:acyl carrier protein